MKTLYRLFVTIFLVLSLTACSSASSEPYTVTKEQATFTVDPTNHTISDGENIYTYELDRDSNCYDITITYPNGSTYWWHSQTSNSMTTGYGGWSDDYDAERYIDGHILCGILDEEAPDSFETKKSLIIVFLIITGVLTIAAPRFFWNLGYGWRYKNAEPSDAALFAERCGGVVLIVIAIVVMLS